MHASPVGIPEFRSQCNSMDTIQWILFTRYHSCCILVASDTSSEHCIIFGRCFYWSCANRSSVCAASWAGRQLTHERAYCFEMRSYSQLTGVRAATTFASCNENCGSLFLIAGSIASFVLSDRSPKNCESKFILQMLVICRFPAVNCDAFANQPPFGWPFRHLKLV